ncbi:hypothetical protein OAU50_05105 [Planctomycetota bacterium]|nr:hypothetical protein [Planctomycetota bacterium]
MAKKVINLCVAAVLLVGAFLSGVASQDGRAQITPSAPIVSAQGSEVVLAWSLPADQRIERVDIMRAPEGMDKFIVLETVDATITTASDATPTLGKRYSYQLRMHTDEGSMLTPVVEVLVGGEATIRLVGGSLDRALFEVTLYRNGQKISEQFLHSTGETVGDLRYPEGIDSVLDFRLGPRLMTLELIRDVSMEVIRTPLQDASGTPLLGPTGKEIPLEFTVPGTEREILKATIKTADGAMHTLNEGESLTVAIR